MHLYLWLIAVRNVLLLLKYLIGNSLALSEKEITLIRLIYFIFYVLTLREKKWTNIGVVTSHHNLPILKVLVRGSSTGFMLRSLTDVCTLPGITASWERKYSTYVLFMNLTFRIRVILRSRFLVKQKLFQLFIGWMV